MFIYATEIVTHCEETCYVSAMDRDVSAKGVMYLSRYRRRYEMIVLGIMIVR